MQSIISNVNSSLIEIEKNQINLVDKYNYLIHEMQVEKLEIGILNFTMAVEERMSLLNLILMQYAFETENIVNIINMAIQGFVHASILDVKTLKNQIKDIKIQLPTGEGLPVDLDDFGISELFRLITTNVIYIKHVLIFEIEIPLVNSYEFLLYKTIPLPINLFNNTYVTIVPTTNYIAVEKSRLYYLELDEIQLSKCKQITKLLICPYDQQLYHLDKSCELSLFRKPNVLPHSCNLRNVNFNFSIWHKLEDTNSWIYITIKDNIIIKCKDMSETITLNVNGTGILELSDKCEANTDDGTLLISKKKLTSKSYKDFIPQLNISTDIQISLNNKDIISNDLIISDKSRLVVKNNLHKLLEYSKSLENLRTLSTSNNNTEKNNHLYVVVGTVIVSMALLVTISLYFVFKHKCKQIINSVEKTIENKLYDSLNLPSQENPLPRIV